MPALRCLTAYATAALAAFSLSACKNSSSDSSTAIVGSSGGQLSVTSGPLAGTVLELPSGALATAIALRFDPVAAPAATGFVAVGPAVQMTPQDLEFAAPAMLTLRLDRQDPVLLSVDAARDLVVLRRDARGRLHVQAPAAVDLQTGRVHAATTGLGVFWPAARPDGARIALADYLPAPFDWYLYDNGANLLDTPRPTEPNIAIPALEAIEWVPSAHADAYQRGFYFARRADGGIELHGVFADRGQYELRYQVVADAPLVLPARVLEGEAFTMDVNLAHYEPFGSTSPIPLSGGFRVQFGERHAEIVPNGAFGDCIAMTIDLEIFGSTFDRLEMLLARDIGPVAYNTFGGSGRMVIAIVDGIELR